MMSGSDDQISGFGDRAVGAVICDDSVAIILYRDTHT